jgi:hypothetical protein
VTSGPGRRQRSRNRRSSAAVPIWSAAAGTDSSSGYRDAELYVFCIFGRIAQSNSLLKAEATDGTSRENALGSQQGQPKSGASVWV